MCSPGEVFPESRDPGWQAEKAPGRGGFDRDLCLHTGFLVAAAAGLAFHARFWCPC